MPASLKNFADLGQLRASLKAQQQERARADAERLQREQEEQREADLFRRSIGTVAPLTVPARVAATPLRPEPLARHRLADEQAALQESLSDDFDVETLLDTDDSLSYTRSGVGADVVRKLRKGHWTIQDQLDLHGLRRDAARDALGAFLRSASRRGLRCVRIIHGKGLGSVNREPVLKQKVRNWLVQKEEVIAFCQAKAADGGSGALVVLLNA
ncbi:Smr/MutS family protein [Herminiimonas sp. CN]|uniref:Smr/MutS family protein n=1 Tax=Herminiimonas sp. CN TaxID=1349818 RepID=UPI00047346E2|nr:Smr/MutS family protein [Herminiimonas sp. CN]